MNYQIRPLEFDDIFKLTSIISKIGVNEIKEVFASNEIRALVGGGKVKESAIQTVGMTVVMNIVAVVLKNLPLCKTELYEFLANMGGLTVEDISKLPPAVAMRMILDIVKGAEFKDFFEVALGSLNSANLSSST